ncbi:MULTISPECIES: hypothetical protein [Pseudomonas]|uniref:hypothetical protein n=1 Tax=Pseudomonas TaxID=286 RepID=UPI001182D3D9|nr:MULTISPECIES: hypothetical protein [Pseudomonas]USX36057.1 hypothetical protein NH673_23080 [Pseudomonas putida]
MEATVNGLRLFSAGTVVSGGLSDAVVLLPTLACATAEAPSSTAASPIYKILLFIASDYHDAYGL